MIKINVITKNLSWLNYIKSPDNYICRKIDKLNYNNKNFKKNHLFCTLLLSGNKEIQKLNKKFRKKNKTTDVLSFPFYNKKILKKKMKKEKEIYLGDIIINISKIKSKKKLKDFKLQLDSLWIHGLVHLFGYDHKNQKDFKKMNKVEIDFLKYIK
jgi:probable rRNA maturation factor